MKLGLTLFFLLVGAATGTLLAYAVTFLIIYLVPGLVIVTPIILLFFLCLFIGIATKLALKIDA